MDEYKQKQGKVQNCCLKSSEGASSSRTFKVISTVLFPFFFCLLILTTEVSSIEWEIIDMTEQEEDIISRMYRLVGDR
ncbi:transcription factor TRY-like [Dorcoceras hygrometricum]|uniref:Transcription factor TRY-like n=1 Tax=Dorcoceras hygrometricum TaxID=472368 RepID=A0A2Z6ZSD6_9LAMI|nr:transcription factor TRY-like [Dorcoceras hygrometricum]